MERLIKLTVSAVLVAHILACIFAFIGNAEIRLRQPNWIEARGLAKHSDAAVYVASLYWSMATISTVGYGDVVSYTSAERIFNLFAIVLGAGAFAFVITSIVGFIGKTSRRTDAFNQKMDSVNAYIRFRRIPSQLADRIRKFHTLAFHGSSHELYHEKEVLDEIPPSLRRRLAEHIHKQLCQWSSFFMGADPLFSLDLSLAMREQYVPAGEVVVYQGESCEEIYLIQEGEVEVQCSPSGLCCLVIDLLVGV